MANAQQNSVMVANTNTANTNTANTNIDPTTPKSQTKWGIVP